MTEEFMKKFLILIMSLGFNSCKSPTQPDTYKSRYAAIVSDTCKTLDRKQERDGVYKTSKGECVVIADYMVKEGEQCKSEIQCEVEAMRQARLQRVINQNEQDLANLEILEKMPICLGLKGGENSRVAYTKAQGYCLLKRSKEAQIAASRAYKEKLRALEEESKKNDPVRKNPTQEPIPNLAQ